MVLGGSGHPLVPCNPALHSQPHTPASGQARCSGAKGSLWALQVPAKLLLCLATFFLPGRGQ